MYQNRKRISSIRVLAFALIIALAVSFTPFMPMNGADDKSVWAASDYGMQGLLNQQIVLVDNITNSKTRTDIKVLQDGVLASNTPFINQISEENQYEDTSRIEFVLKMDAGFNTITKDTFINKHLQNIKIYKDEETRGDAVASNSALNTGNLKVDQVVSKKGIELYLDAGTLEAGKYVLVFSKDLSGNNSDRTLGVDVEYKFTVWEEGSVNLGDVIGLELSNQGGTVSIGQEFNLGARLSVYGKGLASEPGITWSITPNDSTVANITSNTDNSAVTVVAIGVGTATITATSDDNNEATANCVITIKEPGTYSKQTDLPFEISSDPVRTITYDSETLTEINNTITGDAFDPKETIGFSVEWGDNTGNGKSATPVAAWIPNISVIDSNDNIVANKSNEKLTYSGEGFDFGIAANTLQPDESYKLVISKDAGTQLTRKIGKNVIFTFKTMAAESLNDVDISVSDQKYTGKALTPQATVKLDGKALEFGKDYSLVYRENINVGTAYVKVIPASSYYTGSKEVFFKINPKDLSAATINSIKDQVYSGSAKTPAVVVQDGSKTLVAGTDYTVTYSSNKNVGKAVATINGAGNYTGSKSVNFNIDPKKNSVSKTTVGKKKMTVKFKKVSAAQKVTKYQVRYKVKGTKKWKTKTVSGKASQVTIKKLKKGKKYQVQVRSYRTVSGTKYYSAWSKTKTTKKIK